MSRYCAVGWNDGERSACQRTIKALEEYDLCPSSVISNGISQGGAALTLQVTKAIGT